MIIMIKIEIEIEKERTSPEGLVLLHTINISKTFFEVDHFHLLYLLIHI